MSSAGGGSERVRGSAPRSRGTARTATTTPLERAVELVELDGALAAAIRGEGGIVLLEGAAGLGKTLLLAHAAHDAEQRGMTVLRARGGELEHRSPFGVALQLLEPHLAAATPRERRRVLAGAAAHAEPLLSRRLPPREGSGPPEPPLLHGLHWAFVNIAERQPLLLAIDDAHAADEASLRALLHTARQVEDLPLAIVLAARPAGATAGGGALAALAGRPRTRLLRIAALSEQAIGEIVRAQLPGADDAFCAACALATGGNPFYARELLAALTAAGVAPDAAHAGRVEELGPATISRAVGARIERLPQGAAALANAVAVLGDGAALADAAALARLDRRSAGRLAAALSRGDVLHHPPELSFVHPIVRQAVYGAIPEADRAALHLRAARRLREAGGGTDPSSERAATHLLQALPSADPWIVECLHGAARRALDRGAPEAAARYLLRALDESPERTRRAELLIDLSRAEALAKRPSAAERIQAALSLLAEPRERARALGQLGQAFYAAGDNPGAASAFDEALTALDGADAELEEELTAGYLGAARLEYRTQKLALTRFKNLLSGSTEATTAAQRELLAQRALEHAMTGSTPAEDVVALIHRAFAGGRMLQDVSADAVAYAGATAALLFCDALHDVEAATNVGLEDARRRGSVVAFALMSTVRGAARYLRGDLTGALGDLQGGLEQVPVMALVRPFAHGWMALAHLDRGELDEAARVVEAPAEEDRGFFTYNWSLFARARLALMRGEPERALEDLLECGRRQSDIPAPNPAILPWRADAAIAAHALGRAAQARELATEELRLARAFRAPRTLGVALRAAGLVADGDEGIALLEQAVATLADSPSSLEHARALLDLGAARRRAGQQALARETLREALDGCHRVGATHLARRAHAELVAAGARPRRPAVRGADALTPSERRVCELADEGLTNREIAQALFVSTKTVEFHLRNAYVKLRIRSRRELSRALDGAGSGAPVDGDGGPAGRGGGV